jgi:hypothetical protein
MWVALLRGLRGMRRTLCDVSGTTCDASMRVTLTGYFRHNVTRVFAARVRLALPRCRPAGRAGRERSSWTRQPFTEKLEFGLISRRRE